MRVYFLLLVRECLAMSILLNAQAPPTASQETASVEYRSPYGFCFSLPENWRGFSIVKDRWKGVKLHGDPIVVAEGLLIKIRNPKWSESDPREDIPVMIFTLEQWQSLGRTFTVSAAPFGPSELGRSGKYVFALPARYNHDLLYGWQEVENIVMGDSFHAPCNHE